MPANRSEGALNLLAKHPYGACCFLTQSSAKHSCILKNSIPSVLRNDRSNKFNELNTAKLSSICSLSISVIQHANI